MSRKMLKFVAWSLSLVMAVSCVSLSNTGSGVFSNYVSEVNASGVPVKENVETTASSNTIIIGVEGVNCTSALQTLLDRVNAERKEACDKGYPDPRDTSRNLTSGDYVPMQIGTYTMQAAEVRAAEAAIYMTHARPNGTACSNVLWHYNTLTSSSAENLSWNSALSSSIDGWINEKSAWVKYKKTTSAGGEVGHYTNLINPDNTYMGTSTFNPTNDSAPYNWSCTAGEYANKDVPLTSLPGAQNSTYIQKMEIPISKVTSKDISGEAMLNTGDTSTYQLLVGATFSGVRNNTVVDCPVYSGVSWSSSNKGIISIDASGNVTAVAEGTATITATFGSQSVSREIVVVPKGTTIVSVANPPMVTTETTKVPVLAKTVEATLSNGSKISVDATWDTYDTDELLTHFTSKEFDVSGKAKGFTITQRIHVNAAKIEKVYTSPDSVTTDCGSLPSKVDVKVTLSNQYTWTYPAAWNSSYFVVWDKTSLEQCNTAAGGDFTITGYLKLTTDNGNEQYPVSVKLHVNPGTPSSNLTDDIGVSGTGDTGGGSDIGGGNSNGGGNSTGSESVPTPTVELTNPSAAPTYSSEWVNGIWYDENGNNAYSGTLSWKSNSSGWWVEDSAGWYPVSSWQKIDGYWYYFNASGYMASSEWVGGYWINGDGTCTYSGVGSWKGNSTGWWFTDSSGWYPASQWQKIDGKWYYFDGSGYMVTNKRIDGYWIGADGVCQ